MSKHPSPIRLGACEVHVVERRLLVDGSPVQIGARAFDLLLALIELHGTLATKNELLDMVWPGLVVEENNLSVQVSSLRKVLGAGAIATVPGRGYRLAVALDDNTPVRQIQAVAPPTVARPFAPDHEPVFAESAPFELLGRDADMNVLATQVGRHALVSIVGAGGVGKTSLARSLLARHGEHPRDGIHWIELAPLNDAAQIAFRIAASLDVELGSGTAAPEALIAALAETQALIALDNCEHLIEPVAALVREGLQRAAGVHWLVTSQEPLRLPAESVYRLDALSVPETGIAHVDAVGYGAVALFAARAAAADRRFALTDDNVDAVIELCRQLDGLPLAIEMAAARVPTLGLLGIRERLGQRLRLLVGSRAAPLRQQTLRAALDWSHALLDGAEQRVFRRLAPFVAGFTARMAQQVVGHDLEPDGVDEWAALEALSALVDKSLVQADASDPPRYALLESTREYATERLVESGEVDTARHRHAQALAAHFVEANADADSMRDSDWLARYLPERDNVRKALAWACQSDDADTLALLVAALTQLDYFLLGPSSILEFDIPLERLQQAPPLLRARAYVEFGWAHYLNGSRVKGAELSRLALDAFEIADNKAGVYRSLAQLVRLHESSIEPNSIQASAAWTRMRRMDETGLSARARLFCEIVTGMGARDWLELMAAARQGGFDALASVCRINLTDQLLQAGRFSEAVRTAQEFIDAGENSARARTFILANQAEALMRLGRIDEALESARAAMRSNPDAMYLLAELLALGAIKQARPSDAAKLIGYADSERRVRGQLLDPAEAKMHAEIVAQLVSALPAQDLEDLRRKGATMSARDLFALATRGSGS